MLQKSVVGTLQTSLVVRAARSPARRHDRNCQQSDWEDWSYDQPRLRGVRFGAVSTHSNSIFRQTK